MRHQVSCLPVSKCRVGFCMFPKSNFKGSTRNRLKSLCFSKPQNGRVLHHLAHFFPIFLIRQLYILHRSVVFFRSRRNVAPVKASTLLSEVFTSQLLPGSNMKTIGVKAFDCLMPPPYLHISVAKKVKNNIPSHSSEINKKLLIVLDQILFIYMLNMDLPDHRFAFNSKANFGTKFSLLIIWFIFCFTTRIVCECRFVAAIAYAS